ncbi:galactose-3-O-sulfotransferase 2-like isoform X2 [Ruditapes philippinarum]|uniref:galactose-3-O-sulfotransferase 2-like isoform X2 n=1 Tax=Ruditapes philippinarum TaxID=129788 RepID=UPI00295B77FD|nr:galactose-3-O-sulfotransferase 2-like isoform X2 [Ruditapes philippinarum]
MRRCLIPKFKSYSRRCRRMPTDAPWQMMTQVVRSRPFLLCILIFLVVFLLTHFVTPLGGVGFVIAKFPAANSRSYGNKSAEQKLYVDSLSPMENFMDISSNEKRNNVRKIQTNTLTNEYETNTCREKKFHVSFLKVHKAGSTTLMNIFLRFAIENKLNIVLPRKSSGYGFNYLGYGKTVFKENIVPIPANETYNILCNHVVYNRKAFHSIMPNDTFYIGIIREPVSHFISAASYYGFYKHLRDSPLGKIYNEKVVSEFLKNPSRTKIQTYFMYNRMSYDFGIPKEKFHDVTYVNSYIDELKRDYSLVLVLEYFQESLVLMKRILCWDTKDILYVPLNAMGNKPDFNLDDNDIKNLRKWNSADFKLYESFSSVFNAKVESHGEDFKAEVVSFKQIQIQVKTFCFKSMRQGKSESVLTIPKTNWGESFTVTLNDCRLMMEPELHMMKRLIENAWSKYNKTIVTKKVIATEAEDANK